ncbi:hypothetical protein AAEH76_22265, partial [Shewanella algae]
LVENIKYDIGTNTQAGTSHHDGGFDVDGNIGYDFGVFRLEAEVAYKRATISTYQSTQSILINQGGRVVAAPAGSYSSGG